MSKLFTRNDVQRINQAVMTKSQTASNQNLNLSLESLQIVRETSLSRGEINAAFHVARKKIESLR